MCLISVFRILQLVIDIKSISEIFSSFFHTRSLKSAMYFTLLLVSWVWPLATQKSEFKTNVFRKESCFLVRMLAVWEDGGLSVPQKPPLKILLSHKSFKGKRGHNLSHWDKVSESLPSPTVCWLVEVLWFFFRCSCLYSSFAWICSWDFWRRS